MLAFLLRLNEAQQMVDRRDQLVITAKDFAGVIEPNFGPINQPVGFRQTVDHFGRKIVSLQSDNVDAAGRAGCPSTSMNGGTSCNTRLIPLTKL